MNKEIFVPVKLFESRFEISNHGRLISIGGKYGGRYILPCYIDSQGYYSATLRMKPYKRKVRIHTLVAEHFISEKPKGKRMTVNHKDGNKLNNFYKNLEWIESYENVHHAVINGLFNMKGENHYNSKMTKEKVVEMRRLYKSGNYTHKKLGEIFGITRRQAGDIINGINWGWLTELIA